MGLRRTLINNVFAGHQDLLGRILTTTSNVPVSGTTATVGTWMICGTGTTPDTIYIKSAFEAATSVSSGWIRIV